MTITKKLIKSKIIKYSEMLGIGDYKYFIQLVDKDKLPKDNYDTYANVLIDAESRAVGMQINKDLLKESPNELDKTLIHELLHVRLAEILSLFSLLCKNYVKDDKAKAVFASQISGHEHKIIVALADTLTDALTKNK